MIIEVTIPQEIVHNLTVEEVVEMNLTGVPVPGGGGNVEAFPVGSIFTTVSDIDPAVLLGYGTWAEFGAGRVLVGKYTKDPDFDTIKMTGGSKMNNPGGNVSAPEFSGNELPAHQHNPVSAGRPTGIVGSIAQSGSAYVNVTSSGSTQVASRTHTHPAPSLNMDALPVHDHGSLSAGIPSGTNSEPKFEGEEMSVVQPYIVVYFWERVA
jgi:hypothetical protein